jgi:hypothetical protein
LSDESGCDETFAPSKVYAMQTVDSGLSPGRTAALVEFRYPSEYQSRPGYHRHWFR